MIVGVQVFADYSSSPLFLYIYLLENFSLDKTLKTTITFKRVAATYHKTILYNRAHNGRFANDGFGQICIASN